MKEELFCRIATARRLGKGPVVPSGWAAKSFNLRLQLSLY